MLNLFNPDTSFTDDFYLKGKYKLIWRLSLVFTVMFTLLSAIFINIDIVAFSIYFTVLLLSIGSIFYLRKSKNHIPIFWVVTISATVLAIYSMNVIRDTLHYSELLWMICIVLFAYIGLSRRVAVYFAVINLFSLLYFLLFRLNTHITQLEPRETTELLAISAEMIFTFSIIVYLLHQNIQFQNYSRKELEISNKFLKERNQENIVLLKEVHHRVKNNLQIVVSLLRIQSSEVKSEEAQEQFENAINRVMTISVIHQKLYELGELSQIEFRDYLHELVDEIKQLHCGNTSIVKTLKVQLDKIDLKCVVPIGLIINELITNSVKHAFADNNDSSQWINIDLFPSDEAGIAIFKYSDSGTWKEEAPLGFGTELIETLTSQLDGEINRVGSTITIRFPYGE